MRDMCNLKRKKIKEIMRGYIRIHFGNNCDYMNEETKERKEKNFCKGKVKGVYNG